MFFAPPRLKKEKTCRLRVLFARVHSHLDLRPHAFAHMSNNQTASTTKHPSTTADGTTRGSLDEEPGAASGPEPIVTPEAAIAQAGEDAFATAAANAEANNVPATTGQINESASQIAELKSSVLQLQSIVAAQTATISAVQQANGIFPTQEVPVRIF